LRTANELSIGHRGTVAGPFLGKPTFLATFGLDAGFFGLRQGEAIRFYYFLAS
jgi:hypothetical protein